MSEKKPFRPRHDGWTPGRQILFPAKLTETGCVADACRAVRLSTTSAYRIYKRLPEFADRWDMALAKPRPILEQAAFDRAVHGVEVSIHRNGKVVATHRKYSDGLLRYMLEREEKRTKLKRWEKPELSTEELRGEIMRKLKALRDANREKERARSLEEEERLRKAGLCP